MKQLILLIVLCGLCYGQSTKTTASQDGNNLFTGLNTFTLPTTFGDVIIGGVCTGCGSGGTGGYATIKNASVAITQRTIINVLGALICADNAGTLASDCKLATNAAVSHQFVTGIDANGNFLRAAILVADVPTLNQSTTGNAATATALDHNPADCSAGSYATGIDATGAATGCTAAALGSVTNIATTSPITGGPITTTGTIACATCTTNAAALTSGQIITGAGGQATQVGNLSGDVTTAGSTVTTLATVATPATATKVTFNAKGLVTSSGTTDVSTTDITGVLKAAAFPALTGDVTTSAGALATTIAAGAVTASKVTPTTGTGSFVFSAGATERPKNVDNIIFADSYGLGDWAADVNQAVTDFGNKNGYILVSKNAGLFASAPVALHGNVLWFIDDADYTSKGISIDQGGGGIRGMGLSNSGSSVFGTRLVFTGTAATDAITITGTAGARLDKNVLEGFICDGNNTARYCLRIEKADGGTARDVRFQGSQTSNTYVVDAIDWKYFNCGWTFCQGNTGAGFCAIWDWGSGNTAIFGGQTEQGAASTNPQFVFSGAINTFSIYGFDMDALFAIGGFILIQGQDANSAFASAPTGGTGKPINITYTGGLLSTTVNSTQGADILVTDATAAQQPANITISNVELNGNSASAVAVKADQAQNVKLKDSFSNGHTTATFSATANAVAPEMVDNLLLDTARVTGTTASICDIWNTTGVENYNCNLIFNQQANKLGQADTVADSGAINTTETIIVKTPALAANRLVAGTHIRMTLTGTCNSSVANTSTFTVRMGTLGTTGDAAVATAVTGVAGTGAAAIPFKVVIDFTVRTVGASGTGFITLALDSNGLTGILAAQTPAIIMPTMSTFNTTTAANILSVSYKSAATTTTSTFKQGVIEIVQN